MPLRPLKPCAKQGCRKLTRSRYCEAHQNVRPAENRLNSNARGYTYQWSKASKAFLRRKPWCSECARQNVRTLATLVDHVIPHKGNTDLFWDESNWQGLCHSCHSKKTAQEDGGFGCTPLPQKKKERLVETNS